MYYVKFIFQDWRANKNNTKGRIFTLLYRIANYAHYNKTYKFIAYPYLVFYKLSLEYLLGFEIPYDVSIGAGLKIHHTQSIVINNSSKIGQNCTIRQNLTIGNKMPDGQCPIVGDNVVIGANVCIIGDITIGNNVIVGAGAVVVKNIPDNSIAVGNPAKIINS